MATMTIAGVDKNGAQGTFTGEANADRVRVRLYQPPDAPSPTYVFWDEDVVGPSGEWSAAWMPLPDADYRCLVHLLRTDGSGSTSAQQLFTVGAPSPPPPPPPGPPTGELIAVDDCSLSTSGAVDLWGGYQGPGLAKLQHIETGGPLSGYFRRFLLSEGDREPGEPVANERNELGGRDFCTFEVGSRYVTRFWTRVPAIPAGQYRTLFQWKHTESNIVSPSPPLSLQQHGDGTLALKQRAGTANGVDIWREPFPVGEWFEIAFDIRYARDGWIVVWLDGSPLGHSYAGPTVKELTDGTVSNSYPRCGIYQRAEMTATWRDLGPVRVEAL